MRVLIFIGLKFVDIFLIWVGIAHVVGIIYAGIKITIYDIPIIAYLFLLAVFSGFCFMVWTDYLEDLIKPWLKSNWKKAGEIDKNWKNKGGKS